MNLVRTYIQESDIQGIGLFADEFIKEGTKIWELGGMDLVITEEDFIALPLTPLQLEYIKKYIYFNSDYNYWVYCGDDAKFTNHSTDPNTKVTFSEQHATKDIFPGEEITCNYFDLDKDFTEDEFNED